MWAKIKAFFTPRMNLGKAPPPKRMSVEEKNNFLKKRRFISLGSKLLTFEETLTALKLFNDSQTGE